MRILMYVRKWNREFYNGLIENVFEEPDILTISDFNGIADIWAGEYIYNNKYDCQDLIYEKQKEDIMYRCRFLRSIDLEDATRLSNRFWNGIIELFESDSFDLVICPLIDCYTMDIVERISRLKGVRFISFVSNFINGYSRFSVRGERIPLNRVISDEEIKNVLDMLIHKEYKPNFALMKEKTKFDFIKIYVKRKLIEEVMYPIMKIKECDKWNYHYNTIMYPGLPTKYLKPKKDKYFSTSLEHEYGENCVYVPLHMTPESTTDYWCEDYHQALYEDSILDLIKNSDKSIHFLVKEHPSMFGFREIHFYEKFLKLENVTLIHPYCSSNTLLDKVQNVLVYTGSVGVEALLRKKRVLTATENYYSTIHPNIIKVDYVSEGVLRTPLVDYDNYVFMKDFLSALFKGKYLADRRMIQDSELDKVSNALCDYMKQLGYTGIK